MHGNVIPSVHVAPALASGAWDGVAHIEERKHTTMSDPTNKAELLTRMRKGYADFEALLGSLNDAQLTTPGVNGDWSVKDILVHLATWQGRMSQRLQAIARGEDGLRLDPAITNEQEMNAFNDATFATNRSRPLHEVREDFRSSYQRLLVDVEAADERDLFDPQRFAWMEGDPLWENVAGNSFAHYEEHIPMIEAWLAGQQV